MTALKAAGIADYHIFLDPQTHTLFAILTCTDPAARALLPQQPVMQRWWAHMADIMETAQDRSPQSQPLLPMFHLP